MKTYPKYFEKIRIRPDPKAEAKAAAPACQWDGCKQPGTHRAPVGRLKEGEYFRFCFDHVREYNKGYNYFSGLSDSEIARYQKVTQDLRNAGIPAEMYLGSSGMKAQMKYADRRGAPAAVILGGDEIAAGQVTIKDLDAGRARAAAITDNNAWKAERPGQQTVARDQLVAVVRSIIE